MVTHLELRDACDADADALTELCFRSKASLGYDATFMERCRNELTVTPKKLAAWRVRIAETAQGKLLGVAAFSAGDERKPGAAGLELLFVEPDAMGRGIGSVLMKDMRSALTTLGVETLWILSDPGAEPFYLNIGAVRAGLRPSDAVEGRQLPWLRLAVGGTIPSLGTSRLLLRPWQDEDLMPFASMNADERVAEFLPSMLDRDESDALAARIRKGFDLYGFGLWAVERTDSTDRPFIGFIGLSVPTFGAPFTPCVEIGWRLASEHWGIGLATEGARTVVEHAFGTLQLDEIMSFTATDNRASRRIMEKLGMSHAPEYDLGHPALPVADSLRPHVLYRLARNEKQR